MAELRMTRKRPLPKRGFKVRISAVLPLALVTLFICSMMYMARLSSRAIAEDVKKTEFAIDKPRDLTSLTIRTYSPVRMSPHTITKEVAKKKLSLKSVGSKMSHSIQLPQQNTKGEEIQEPRSEYRYKLGLVRVLGNPIPPEQNQKQALQNLEFLLENEPTFETTVDKHWILNRIVDDEFLQKNKNLLRDHNQTFSVIPFSIKDYQSKAYRYVKASKKIFGQSWVSNEVDLLRNISFWEPNEIDDSMKKKERLRQKYLDALYTDKNLYVINQNNARNIARELYTVDKKKKKTRFDIDYILPWDGDCFLTQTGHDLLHRDLERHNDEQQLRIAAARTQFRRYMRADDDATGLVDTDDDFIDNEISKMMKVNSIQDVLEIQIKYFFTPFQRLNGSNDTLINDHKFSGTANEEQPQLVFHRSALAKYDPNGINQIYMLEKLHVKGPWNQLKKKMPFPNDYNYHSYNLEDEFAPSVGGNTIDLQDDVDKDVASPTIDNLETPSAGWVAGLVPVESNPGTTNKISRRRDFALFCRKLDLQAVKQGYLEKIYKDELEGDLSPYLFYNQMVLKEEARVYKSLNEREKGDFFSSFDVTVWRLVRVADSLLRESTESALPIYARQSIAKFQYDSAILGLAYELTGKTKYAKAAAEIIRYWFLNPETRLGRNWNNVITMDSFLKLSATDLEDISNWGLEYEYSKDAKCPKQVVEKVKSWFSSASEIQKNDLEIDSDRDNTHVKADLALSDFEDIVALGLAYESTKDLKYALAAAEKVRSWISNPNLERPQLSLVDFKNVDQFLDVTTAIKKSGETSGIAPDLGFTLLDFENVYFFLDAVKMVQKSGELSEFEFLGLRDWFQNYLDRLLSPGRDLGIASYYENDYNGLNYDIQLVSVAIFTGNEGLAVQIAHESTSRMIAHVHKLNQALERDSAYCGEDLVALLQGWVTLTRIVSNSLGIHLWKKLPMKRPLNNESKSAAKKPTTGTMENQPFLCRAPEYAVLLSSENCGTDTARGGNVPNDEKKSTRWLPIHMTAQHWPCPDHWKVNEEPDSHYKTEPMYDASSEDGYSNYGIAPFWNLGLKAQRRDEKPQAQL